MSDTPPEIQDLQRQLFLRMSPKERFAHGMQQIEDVRRIAENSLRQAHPEASTAEIKVLLLQRYYGHELSPEVLAACSEQMYRYWQQRG
jgi:hypothetical protein